ncbi:MAG: Hsp20/alpha crystallin family protein [Acidiferrobacterales bacterium]
MGETSEKVEVGSEKSEQKEQPSRSVRPFSDVESWFQEMFPRMMRPGSWEWPEWPSFGHIPRPFEGKTPRVDVIDRDGEVLVKAEMPGVSKENLEISTTGNTVTIKGTSRYEHKEEKGDYHRSEISHGVFARTVTLPAEVNSDEAEARFKDGLLELTLPKRPQKEGHKIQVK